LELCSPHYDKIPAVSQGLIKLWPTFTKTHVFLVIDT
jgi:hypothetical protein